MPHKNAPRSELIADSTATVGATGMPDTEAIIAEATAASTGKLHTAGPSYR
jgi:hypothetical protein